MKIRTYRLGLWTLLKVAVRKAYLTKQKKDLEDIIIHTEKNISAAQAYVQQCKLRAGRIKYKLEDLQNASE